MIWRRDDVEVQFCSGLQNGMFQAKLAHDMSLARLGTYHQLEVHATLQSITLHINMAGRLSDESIGYITPSLLPLGVAVSLLDGGRMPPPSTPRRREVVIAAREPKRFRHVFPGIRGIHIPPSLLPMRPNLCLVVHLRFLCRRYQPNPPQQHTLSLEPRVPG